jgi:hypothetical protein
LGAQEQQALLAQLSGDRLSALWSVKLQVSGAWLTLDCMAHRQADAVILELELPLARVSVEPFDAGIHLSIALLNLAIEPGRSQRHRAAIAFGHE